MRTQCSHVGRTTHRRQLALNNKNATESWLVGSQASAEDMSRRNFLSSAAVAAVGLSLPRNAEAKKAPVEEEEEDEEEEEEQTTPAVKFRTEGEQVAIRRLLWHG